MAVLRGLGIWELLPYVLVAAIPAVMGILLTPVLDREWAQILVIFSWIALAIAACVGVAFWPMAMLFLCAPAAAALFEREKIIEALFLASLFAGVIYLAGRTGNLPETMVSDDVRLWSRLGALTGVATLLMSTLFAASNTAPAVVIPDNSATIPAYRGATDIAMLDALSGGIIRINGDDDVTFVSVDAYDIFNLPEDSGHLTMHALLVGKEGVRQQVLDLIARTRASGDAEQITITIPGGDNGPPPHVLDLRATPLTDGEIILHGMDATEREDRIAALNADWVSAHQNIASVRQDMDDKSLFFSGVSHELRTPLNAIIGFSDMMRSRLFGPLPSKYAEYADLIHDSGQHMLDLIGDVLDMSKVEAGKYELNYGMFDMADVIRSSVKMVRPAADAAEVVVYVDIAADQDLLVDADRKAVRQIILNLLSNAIKFTPKGGRVDISSKIVADTLHMSVSDNGAGMDAGELARIGQPFAQGQSAQMTDQRGSGLGLSLVKSLTDLHKGRFAIASQRDSGTSVDIYLPLSRESD